MELSARNQLKGKITSVEKGAQEAPSPGNFTVTL